MNSAHGAVFSLKAMLARMRKSADRASSAGGTSHGSASSSAVSEHGIKFAGPDGAPSASVSKLVPMSAISSAARWNSYQRVL